MLLLLRNNKPYPTALLKYFGGLDEYRYELYKDLKSLKKMNISRQYNNHLDLGKSKLMEEKTYDKPDSIVFVDRLAAEVKGRKGLVISLSTKQRKMM